MLKYVGMESSRLQQIDQILKKSANPAYRLDQIKKAIYKEGLTSYPQITVLPKDLREFLATELGEIQNLKEVAITQEGQAQKILFETKDGYKIETVKLLFENAKTKKPERVSLCISSQSGCGLGCQFCATGTLGFGKDLSADEITDQVLYFKQKGINVDSISFMGMGEPLLNPSIFDALKMLTAPDLFGMSPRRLSVSTVGIVPAIKRLAEEFPQVNLAISLHTPFQEQRKELMPIARKYSVEKLFAATNEYIEKTNNRIFIAYLLLETVTDSYKHAKALINLIKHQKHSYLYHVNLIRYHPGPEKAVFKCPSTFRVNAFRKILSAHGISNTLRQSFGVEINAACGQLANSMVGVAGLEPAASRTRIVRSTN